MCDYPHCKSPGSVIYIDSELCNKHWHDIAVSEDEEEVKLLRKIGLKRVDGVVIKA